LCNLYRKKCILCWIFMSLPNFFNLLLQLLVCSLFKRKKWLFLFPDTELKKKWQHLRHSFRVILGKLPRDPITKKWLTSPSDFNSEWKYYKHMLFLCPQYEVLKIRKRRRRLQSTTNEMSNETTVFPRK
jgi:hypothetical protein